MSEIIKINWMSNQQAIVDFAKSKRHGLYEIGDDGKLHLVKELIEVVIAERVTDNNYQRTAS